eukprot:scaffold155479_cov26-Tisochrysis_lutea.AAC.1
MQLRAGEYAKVPVRTKRDKHLDALGSAPQTFDFPVKATPETLHEHEGTIAGQKGKAMQKEMRGALARIEP